MRMRLFKQVLAVCGLAVAASLAGSCGDVVRQGTGSAFLVIDTLEGASGADTSPKFSAVLQSDVRTRGGWVEDPGFVRLRLVAKDISSPLTSNNAVTINRYRVVYRRTDGRNQQGVDVPYAFDGAITITVPEGGDQAESGFVLVRVQAKLEPPLITMTDPPVVFGGGVVISTLADVTFFGRDQTGHEVSVTGTIGINFTDWADPD